MTTTTSTNVLEALVEKCRKAWSDALTRIVGAACEVQVGRETGPLPETMPVCVMLNAEGMLSGQAALVLDQRNASMLAAKIGGASGLQAVQDLVRQTAALALNDFQKQYGSVRAQLAVGAAPNWRPQTALTLLAGNGGPESLRAHLLLSPQIESSAVQAPAGSGVDAVNSPQPSAAALPPNRSGRNMNLVMGVQLEVTLRFGQKKLPLKQLVELNAGAVVELDKRVHEPVELLLKDRVFARGEVVIVDGHYGLRVTEVSDANQENL
jgi:flagellar motor switch protein FliN